MATTNNVIDLSILKRKSFQVGDKTLELDTSDLKILSRFEDMYPKLLAESDRISELGDVISSDNPDTESLSAALDSVDKTMREAIDYIFDSNVCEICMDHGSVFDPIDGKYRFEHVIDAILPLYEKNLADETRKIQNRIKTHTSKYTKKK